MRGTTLKPRDYGWTSALQGTGANIMSVRSYLSFSAVLDVRVISDDARRRHHIVAHHSTVFDSARAAGVLHDGEQGRGMHCSCRPGHVRGVSTTSALLVKAGCEQHLKNRAQHGTKRVMNGGALLNPHLL